MAGKDGVTPWISLDDTAQTLDIALVSVLTHSALVPLIDAFKWTGREETTSKPSNFFEVSFSMQHSLVSMSDAINLPVAQHAQEAVCTFPAEAVTVVAPWETTDQLSLSLSSLPSENRSL